jgi:hypothetical protein
LIDGVAGEAEVVAGSALEEGVVEVADGAVVYGLALMSGEI